MRSGSSCRPSSRSPAFSSPSRVKSCALSRSARSSSAKSMAGVLACDRVFVEEAAYPWDQGRVSIFHDVVAGGVEGHYLRARQRVAEAGEKVAVEHEVAQAPADECGAIGELVQPAPHFLEQRPGAVALAQRNVLHEAQRADRVVPAAVHTGKGRA